MSTQSVLAIFEANPFVCHLHALQNVKNATGTRSSRTRDGEVTAPNACTNCNDKIMNHNECF